MKNSSWPRTRIDHFALARMESENIDPFVDADRYTLMRRVSYELTGLPPTVEELNAFVNDPLPRKHYEFKLCAAGWK